MPTKALFWVGTSLEDIRAFPADARRVAGHQLHLVQQEIEPADWKPMPTVGSGVYELRIRTRLEHRVFYIAKLSEGIYVLHAFEKRTRKTPQADVDLAKTRRSKNPMSAKITRSSGNVFRDLGFPASEAAHLLIRSELMIQLRKIIESRGLKQAEVARMLRVSQPRVSALMKGRIDLFSVDTLIDMLARAGFKVKVALIKSSPRKVA